MHVSKFYKFNINLIWNDQEANIFSKWVEHELITVLRNLNQLKVLKLMNFYLLKTLIFSDSTASSAATLEQT